MQCRILAFLGTVFMALTALADQKQGEGKPEWMPPFEVDEDTLKVLKEINSLSAYQRPKLPLKLDERYAHTSHDMEPFRHVEPFKRHFLLQMEYTGRGGQSPSPST